MNAAVQTNKPEGSATTCVVGCKLPHGLHLDLKGKDGTTRFTLKGNNASRIVGGYGLTEGIPTDFMQEWLKRNKEHPAVKAGAIFMHTDGASAESRAKEGREIRTGLEPIDPIAEAQRKRPPGTVGVDMDADAVAAYERAKKENPVRNRQVVE